MSYDPLSRSVASKAQTFSRRLTHCLKIIRLENAVKGKLQRVENANLSLIGFCTNETWDALFTPSFLDIGFVNRLWIVPGEARHRNDWMNGITLMNELSSPGGWRLMV